MIADAITREIGKPVSYRDVETTAPPGPRRSSPRCCGFLAPVVLGSGVAAAVLGMVSDLAGTVAGLLAAQHPLGDPSLTRALYELNIGVHLAFFPLVALTATLAAAIFQGAIGARRVSWLSVLWAAGAGVRDRLGQLQPAIVGLIVLLVAVGRDLARRFWRAGCHGGGNRAGDVR